MGLRKLQASWALFAGWRTPEWPVQGRFSIQDVRVSYMGRNEAVDAEAQHHECAP